MSFILSFSHLNPYLCTVSFKKREEGGCVHPCAPQVHIVTATLYKMYDIQCVLKTKNQIAIVTRRRAQTSFP